MAELLDPKLWERFVILSQGVSVSNLVTDLLGHGVSGSRVLQSMLTIRAAMLSVEQLANTYLPWYSETWLGEGAWDFVESQQLTVKQWSVLETTKEDTNKKVARMVANPNKMGELGEILVVVDTSLAKSVVVDGCHRACANFILEKPTPAIIALSAMAHILYPRDFLRLAWPNS